MHDYRRFIVFQVGTSQGSLQPLQHLTCYLPSKRAINDHDTGLTRKFAAADQRW